MNIIIPPQINEYSPHKNRRASQVTRGKESTCQAGVSYPLWVALGKDSVCIGICQIDQEGAARQRGQAVFDGEVHSCLQGLSIPSQHLSVTFPLSAGRKETDGGVRGFSVCHLEADGKMRTCHSSEVSTCPQPVSSVSRKNGDRTSLSPILQDSANPSHGVYPLLDTICHAYHINPYLLHEARFNRTFFEGWGLCRAALDIWVA